MGGAFNVHKLVLVLRVDWVLSLDVSDELVGGLVHELVIDNNLSFVLPDAHEGKWNQEETKDEGANTPIVLLLRLRVVNSAAV